MKLVNKRARFADVVANRTKALINWQPFDINLMRAIYNYADKVRRNDPVWNEFILAKKALDKAYIASIEKRAADKAERRALKANRKAEKRAAKEAKKAKQVAVPPVDGADPNPATS